MHQEIMIPRYWQIRPAIIALLLLVLISPGCGPSQEELKIGALQHFRKGNQHFANDNPKSAITEYRMAIALDDQQAAFYFNLGLAYYRLVLYDQAIEAYRIAIKKSPDLGEAWYNLSLALDKIGESDQAFMAYGQYQKLNQTQTIQKKNQPDRLSCKNPNYQSLERKVRHVESNSLFRYLLFKEQS